MIDIKKVKADAAREMSEEKAERAKNALLKKLRERDAAQQIVRNIDREIADLEASITEGSF